MQPNLPASRGEQSRFSDDELQLIEESLQYLRTFAVVAEQGSIARAADSLYRATSAVNRSIQELEQRVGCSLFDRHARGMLLNRMGESVLIRTRRIQEEVDQALDEMLGASGKHSERQHLTTLLLNGRKLMLLVWLARVRQISSVARHFGMSQSGVSMFLSRFEEAVGQPLFQRMAQGLITTDRGARLVFRAKRILAELRHIPSDLSAMHGMLTGEVTIGALPLGRTHILPTALAKIVSLHPGIRIKTVESPYESLAAGLRSGEIDFIFGALRPADKELAAEPLFIDEVSVVVRQGHPLLQRAALTLADLRDMPWILSRQDSPSRQGLEISFRDIGLRPPQPSIETGDLAILRSMLLQSDCITAISLQQLGGELSNSAFATLPIGLEKTRRQIGITTRAGGLQSPAVSAVVEAIRQVCLTGR